MEIGKLSALSSRKRIVLLGLFAAVALLILTAPGPAAILGYIVGKGPAFGTQLGQRDLRVSLVADAFAWLTCLFVAIVAGRLTHRLRDRVPFRPTLVVLGFFLAYFGLLRMVGYATLWSPLARLSPELLKIRAAASVVVAVSVAVLFPYVRNMIQMVISSNKDHEKFVVAAESSLDAFYIMDCVRDASNDITDFRFSYVNANGEHRIGRPRAELVGMSICEVLPYLRTTDIPDRLKVVVQTGVPFTLEHQVVREGFDPYWIVMQVVKLGDGIAVTNRDVTEERARQHQIADLNEFNQSMIENAPFSIIATDPAGTVTAMNPAAESLTFYRKHELVGQHSVVLLHDAAEMSARGAVEQRPERAGTGWVQLADRAAATWADRRA